MPVATAAIETTGGTTETTGIFDISEIISIKTKELRTNSDSIPNNISCNEPPNCSTPKSNRFAVEYNSLNCNHKNAHLTVLEGSNTKINVPDVQDVLEDNVLNNMLTKCSLLNEVPNRYFYYSFHHRMVGQIEFYSGMTPLRFVFCTFSMFCFFN